MRLGIDLDGVVADFNSGWIARYNSDFDAALGTEAVVVWDAMTQLTHFADDGAFWRWAAGANGSSVFRHLETYPGAIEALTRLARNHSIVIITTKPDWAIHDTFAWIADQHIPTREVHMTREKWRVPCDVYLDDAPHQIEELHRNRPESVVCRFVRPWNDARVGVRDIRDWNEFVALVDAQWC